jgi:molybdopterin/thiamine biosynthesis adenylyltransferase
MTELRIEAADAKALLQALLGHRAEHAAILLATQAAPANDRAALLVREVELPSADDYITQRVDGAVLKPEFVARVTKRARIEGLSLVFVHSHPGSTAPRFSVVDDEGEQHLAAFLEHRCPSALNASVVVSEGGIRARRLGTRTEIRVLSIGERRQVLFDPDSEHTTDVSEVFDRQVRAFGIDGQRELQRLRIGIVGLGGTGSIVAQQLAHLGIRSFLLMDPDVIEASNLNRVVGASAMDIGRPKVEVAADYIRKLAAGVSVTSVQGDIIYARTARALLGVDLIFGCTDSHGSRAVLQQVSYQYLIPCVDMGTTIVAEQGGITAVFGRVQMLAPGLACLSCSNLLDPEEIRRDMMTAFERKADPYIQGDRIPAPSVIALNGTVSSLAVTMFMSHAIGTPGKARYLLYNGTTSALRSVRSEPKGNCYICSKAGAFGRGDSQRLFARQD